MLDARNPVVWLIGIIAFIVAMAFVRGYFTSEARARRRLDKTHRQVISRKQGPTVRLAAEVGKPKRDRKR